MAEDLTSLYEHLLLEKKTPLNICAFISGSERSGTSWCALNMAYAINSNKKRVLLVDGNGDFSNINSYLAFNNPPSLGQYISGKKTLNQVLIAYKNRDFNILTDLSGNNYLEKQPLGRVHIYEDDLMTLAKSYDCTLIDIGSNLDKNSIDLCRVANNIIILCSENNIHLTQTYELLKSLSALQIPANYYLIINKVNSFEDGYKIYEKLNKAVERTGLTTPALLGIIRFDARVRETIRNKELLQIRYPTSEAAIDIYNIAKQIPMEDKNG